MKARKILSCLVLVASMSVLLLGCSNNQTNAIEVPEERERISADEFKEELAEQETEDDTEETAEAVPEVEDEEEASPSVEEDPLAPLMVTEEFAKQYGGLFLYRNGNLYTLNWQIPAESSRTYNVGQRLNADTPAAMLYYVIGEKGYNFLTMGDVPLVTLQKGDELRGYKEKNIGMLDAKFTGYSIRICEGLYDVSAMLIFNSQDNLPVALHRSTLDNFKVTDNNGNEVEDFHNLQQNETYTVSWYENNTEYHETQMVADCKCYSATDKNPTAPFTYSVDGELGKDGYAVFDLSDFAPGLYYTHTVSGGNGFIEIS